jgi:large subunit ribosomal protein L3
VSVEWFSKWKWFTWAMKRHNFSWGPAGHGSKFHRALGSIGTRKPRRTHKWKKMHGHLGDTKFLIKNVPVELVNKEINVIGVRWWVPGGRNSYVNIIF